MNLTWNEVDLDLAVFERFCSILDSTCPKALIVYHRRHLKDFINSRISIIPVYLGIMHSLYKKYQFDEKGNKE